jgi:hypothetical protein
MLGCYPDAVVEGLYTLEGGQTATGAGEQPNIRGDQSAGGAGILDLCRERLKK